MERVQRRGARSRTGAHLFVAVGLIALSFLPQSLTYSPSLLSLSHGVRTQPPRATFSSPLPLARPLQNHQKARLVVLRESEAAGAEAATADPEMSRMEAAEQKAKSEVYHVVETMMKSDSSSMRPAPLGELPPTLFTDHQSALLNEPVYKSVMYRRLEACKSEEELQQLEAVDEILLTWKKEQRDSVNKEKLEIIIGCALAGPEMLDDVLNQMRDTRGLDDGMIDYIDDVIAQAKEKEPLNPQGVGSKGQGGEPLLVRMLTVMKDRLVAEIRTRDKPYVRLLAALLRMPHRDEREEFLAGTVRAKEEAMEFAAFILDGIQYMEQHRADWLVDERVEKMKQIVSEVEMYHTRLAHTEEEFEAAHEEEKQQ